MKAVALDLLDTIITFVTNRFGRLAARGRPHRHVAEENRIRSGDPVDRDATTLLRA
jgi:hypothetical protein